MRSVQEKLNTWQEMDTPVQKAKNSQAGLPTSPTFLHGAAQPHGAPPVLQPSRAALGECAQTVSIAIRGKILIPAPAPVNCGNIDLL